MCICRSSRARPCRSPCCRGRQSAAVCDVDVSMCMLTHLDIDVQEAALCHLEHEPHLGAGDDAIEEALLLIGVDVDEVCLARGHAPAQQHSDPAQPVHWHGAHDPSPAPTCNTHRNNASRQSVGGHTQSLFANVGERCGRCATGQKCHRGTFCTPELHRVSVRSRQEVSLHLRERSISLLFSRLSSLFSLLSSSIPY